MKSHLISQLRTIFFCITAAAAMIPVFSCKNIFSPALGELDGGESIYRMEMASPEDVLHNFRYAYIYRDSLMYAMLLDSEFVFVYYQPSTESGTGHYDSWMRNTELRTTGRMFSAFSYIDLIWQTTLDSVFYDMDGEEIIQEEDTLFDSANIADISKSYQLTLGDYYTLVGDAAFRFRKNADGKWRILRWEDKYNTY
ncbi:MAG: hypothetical protein U5N56_07165 [Candidatus Marinimicrobia bacterium]|nr:hypothetical protein [Candidatus Neomarinimicrobiota bacterium]